MRIQPVLNYNNISRVNFKSNKEIKEKFPLSKSYGINPSNVAVVTNENIQISEDEKATLIEKIIEAHILAKKNYNYGNIASAGYSTNIGLENGLWHVATNFNNTRNDISAICGERSAILGAYNDLLKQKPLIPYSDQNPLDFKIKYMAMSSYKELGTDKNAASSCAECLSWFNTPRYFSDNTIIASMLKDKQGKFYLKLSKLQEYLPYRNEVNVANNVQISSLPIKLTKKALDSAKQKGIKENDIKKLLQQLKINYYSRNLTSTSNQNIQAGVIANGEIFTGSKIDFTKRWHVDAIQFAAAKAIEKFGNNTQIDLIAVVGDGTIQDKDSQITHQDGILNLKILGELNTKFAKADTLVVTNTDKEIHIRTIDDFMPSNFKFDQGYHIK